MLNNFNVVCELIVFFCVGVSAGLLIGYAIAQKTNKE